jgi:hypothetical protein
MHKKILLFTIISSISLGVVNADNIIHPNETMQQGESIDSPNGQSSFTIQDDGNIVLYSSIYTVATNNFSQNNRYIVMQGDCNLVAYEEDGSGRRAIWSTDTSDPNRSHKNCYAQLQDDGNLLIYDDTGSPVWAACDIKHGWLINSKCDIIKGEYNYKYDSLCSVSKTQLGCAAL